MTLSIETKISPTNLFHDLIRDKKASNCTLITPNGKNIYTQKLFLAKNSKYFLEIFKRNPETSIINIPYDSLNFFEDFYNILINFRFTANPENTLKIVKYSEYYGVDCILTTAKKLINEVYKDYSTFNLCKLMIKTNLIEEIIERKDQLANELISANSQQKIEMYKALTPIIMFHVLQTPAYKAKTQEQLFNIIDQYYNYHTDMQQEDKEKLSSLIDFDAEDAYKYVLQSDCDWVDPHITRTLYSNIITKRREAMNSFSQQFENIQQNHDEKLIFSRLFPFQFISYIYACKHYNANEPIPIVSMLSTMGYYLIKPIELFKYGILSFESKLSVYPGYGPDNLFIEDKYFWAGNKQDESPFISIGLEEKSRIQISDLIINSVIVNTTTHRNRKMPTLQLFSLDSSTPISHVAVHGANYLTLVPDNELITNKINIKLIKSNPYDFCLRINTLEINGIILP